MIYEVRTYEITPSKRDAFITRWNDHTMRLFERHNIRTIVGGFNQDNDHKFFYVLEFDDESHHKTSWENFIHDPERVDIWNQTNQPQKLVINIEKKIYTGSDLSSLT